MTGEALPDDNPDFQTHDGPDLTFIAGGRLEEEPTTQSLEDLISEAWTLPDFHWWQDLAKPEIASDLKAALIAENPQDYPPTLSRATRNTYPELQKSLAEPLTVGAKFQPLLELASQNPVIQALVARQRALSARSQLGIEPNQELNDSLTIVTKLTLAEILNFSFDPTLNATNLDWPAISVAVLHHFKADDAARRIKLR